MVDLSSHGANKFMTNISWEIVLHIRNFFNEGGKVNLGIIYTLIHNSI